MRLVLVGASGHGKVTADTALAAGWTDIVFLDDAWPKRERNGPWAVIGGSDRIEAMHAEGAALFITIGANATRARVADRAGRLATLVHPAAYVSPRARLGEGTLAVAGAVVNIDAEIGRGVILNTCCTIDHDCRIGDYAHVSPGANLAGGVVVGPRAWIGIGAAVRQGVTIGADARVGAGAAVVRDVPNGETVAGVPARTMESPDA